MAVKLIFHTGEVDDADDLTMPIKLEMYLRAPSFMVVAFVSMYGGSERVVARADTEEEMTAWMDEKGLTRHQRLSRFLVTNARGEIVRSYRWPEQADVA